MSGELGAKEIRRCAHGTPMPFCGICRTPEEEREIYGDDPRPLDLDKVFDLLILARNSKDAEALQEAIDLVATASCRSLDF